MNYCDFQDIQAEFKKITFDSASNVTDTAVTDFITEASAYIDSRLNSRYVTPVTGAVALSLCKLFARTLVSDRVRAILETKQITNLDVGKVSVKGNAYTTADVKKDLQAIQDGIMPLIGETLALGNAGFKSFNSDNNTQPVFKKDVRQW